MRSPNCILPSWTSTQYLIPYSVCFFLSSWQKSCGIMSATVLRYRNCPFWLLTCRSCTSLLNFMLMMGALFWEENNWMDWNSKITNIWRQKKKEKKRNKKKRRKEEETDPYYLLGTAQHSSCPCRRHTRYIEGNQLFI